MKDRPLLALAIAQTMIWAATFYLFPALLLRWEHDFSWSKPELTGAISMAIFIAALVSPLSGRIIDRGYGHYMLSGCVVASGLLLLLLSRVTQL